MKTILATAMLALPLAFTAHTAAATTVAFTGSGEFSNLTNCTSGSPACSITSVAGGYHNLLGMSGFSAQFPYSPSTLTAVTTSNSIAVTTTMPSVTLGEIDWTNRATYNTDQNFYVTYTFTLSFSAPNASSESQAFRLNILQTANPNGDTVLNLSNASLAGLGPFNLDGVTLSNLHFVLASNSRGTYDGTNWSDPEGATSRLLIKADISTVPEPLSLALLGTGLAGIVVARRRQRH